MAIEMMELLAMLAQGRKQELVDRMAEKADAPAMNFTAAQPQMNQPAATTPPITPPVQDPTGTLTGPGMAGLPGPIGTQSGPAVKNPEQEKAELQDNLGKIIASGILPEAKAREVPFPGQAPGGGPSLGSASLAQPFNLTTPNAGGQTQLSLARLLNGGA